MKKGLIILFSIGILFSSCTKKPPIEGLNTEVFRSDRGACKGLRKQFLPWFQQHRLDWKGVSSNDIEDVLGKPDIQQLADRNQEYYIYFFEPGAHCQDPKNPSNAQSISFRFSAMGLATEVTFQKGI